MALFRIGEPDQFYHAHSTLTLYLSAFVWQDDTVLADLNELGVTQTYYDI